MLTGPGQGEFNCLTDWANFLHCESESRPHLEDGVAASSGTPIFQLKMTNIHRLAFGLKGEMRSPGQVALHDEVRVNQSG
ncbi:hypothetical protein EBU99_13465 [bacterium]|nr:hypothetical protein [bacterium]